MSDASDRGITVTEMTAMDEPVDVNPPTVAAFVGRALRGPLNTPVLVRSLAQFSQRFGGVWGQSSLGPAVQQFFEHGGRRAYIVRVANNAIGAILRLPCANGMLALEAVEPGSTEHIRASVDYDRIADNDHFNLTVQRISPSTGLVIDQEIHTALSCREESRRYVVDVLLSSDLVRVQQPVPPGRPLATVGRDIKTPSEYIAHAERGSDGDALSDYDLIGSTAGQTGMFALDGVDNFDLLYLPPPGRHLDLGPTAILAAELYCRKRGAMLVVDPHEDWSDVDSAVAGMRATGYSSPNLMTYFPRVVERSDPTKLPRVAGGAIAGLLCKLDERCGPWYDLDHPGFRFRSHLQPAMQIAAADGAALVRAGFNVIAKTEAGRASLCGSVTLAGDSQLDRKFACLHVRRLCLHVTNAIGRATRWAVFQPGGTRIAHRVRAQVHAFMVSLAESGAFGNERFDVHCESGLHVDPLDPKRGVTILLSFQPAGSPEYVWLTLHQSVQGCRVAATAFAPVTAECA